MPVAFIKLLSFLLLSFTCWHIQAEESPTIAIIVSSDAQIAPKSTIAPNELSLIYWRKTLYLKDGQQIHPANLHAEHPLRLAFSKAVLESLPKDQTDYWNGLYFHGVSPPRSLLSEEAVIRYVAETKGGIGYINACNLNARVKPILWIINNHVTNAMPDKINCDVNSSNNN
jgi:hypothetical protein